MYVASERQAAIYLPCSVMATTYITKEQRKILIDSYIECADEMGLDDLDETQARLEKLSNTKLIAECVAFMPDCLEEI